MPVARINRAAFAHNCMVLGKRAGRRKMFAVLKADAYGHGVGALVRTAAVHADGLCVFSAAEALEVAEVNGSRPVLLMGGCNDTECLGELARLGIWVGVTSAEQARMTVSCGQKFARLFIKVQTGMHRLGLEPDAALRAADLLSSCTVPGGLALMHHFADAEEPGGTREQCAVFARVVSSLRLPFSSSNTAATLLEPHPLPGEEFVRCGIGVYGCSPVSQEHTAAELGLLPVMTLEAEVLAVQRVPAGGAVSYGAQWRAQQDTEVAIVGCGYADGYPRAAFPGAQVLVNGLRCPVAGRVCMDMLAVDLRGTSCKAGDKAVLWGEGLPADDVAKQAGTISYELLSGLTGRVRRECCG